MYYNRGHAGVASRRYAAVHAGSQIDGASPHALVKILFDELLIAMSAAALAERQGERAKAAEKNARSLSILHALDSSLDFEKGGDVALGLAQIYREARRLMIEGARQASPEPVQKARAMIAEIAEAWNQIA